MLWAGICYGQRRQVHFIDGILNAQKYSEILRSIVVPFIHNHHLMLQHDNAWPHVARICSHFLESENIPVLTWPAYSPDMSPIEHVSGCSGSAYTTACSSSCHYLATLHNHLRGVDHYSTGHNKQPDQQGDVLHCGRQIVVTPDTDWFSDHGGKNKSVAFEILFSVYKYK